MNAKLGNGNDPNTDEREGGARGERATPRKNITSAAKFLVFFGSPMADSDVVGYPTERSPIRLQRASFGDGYLPMRVSGAPDSR